MVHPTGVKPAKSRVESPVPFSPGEGWVLVRTAGFEPTTSVWKTDTLPLRHARNWRRVERTMPMPCGTNRLANGVRNPPN